MDPPRAVPVGPDDPPVHHGTGACQGRILLDGEDVAGHGSKAFARRVALLPQSATAPGGITVHDLVTRGRYPHQGLLRQWSVEDGEAVATARRRTRHRPSGPTPGGRAVRGQRQQAWIAMALAQRTSVLLLDEPTTFIDLARQLDVLDMCRELVDRHDTTVVAVPHDLHHTARYADRVIVPHEGRVHAHGSPGRVLTAETLRAMFEVSARIVDDPVSRTPLVVPERRQTGHDQPT